MLALIGLVRLPGGSKLGRCSLCLRKAFQMSALAWALTLVLFVASSSSAIWRIAFVVSVSLTVLWIAHVLAFSARSTALAPSRRSETFDAGRRRVWLIILRASGLAVLASATLRPAFAESPCGGWPDQGLPCGPCERRNTVNSECEPCHSCGQDCQGNC